MFTNSVPNSDSEQCTESKLGWVHQVHTLAQPTRTSRAHCAQAGLVVVRTGQARPCRNAHPAVSCAVPCSPCRRAPEHAAVRIVAPYVVSWRFPPAVSRLSRDTTQRPSRPPFTIQFIVSPHTPSAARPLRARHKPLRAGRPCRRASRSCSKSSPRSYRGPIRSYRGRPWALAAPCVTIQSTVS